ncbi:putative lipoprotein [Pantoea sp. AS-PWVM4]|uniref:YaeF family permuted papain-like enzyme n=1 Tax=Pantoea sp. AS-PWVM4 TaxID=1332069 RepID=UPI0003AC7F9E|nr:YaeF family permuted papain-like enzyme [Pantoea sp. AS-PWVM4]ERK13899.1 putative lipoprotein [Pantoea sp. AS-PWVM4]
MKLFVLVIFLLAGCSTAPKHQQGFPLKFQSVSTHPSALIAADALQPGDLLLSSATSLQSWGIRLFTLTGVSHAAIYLGDQRVAEAVGSGVNIIPLDRAIAESNNLLALRIPGITVEQTLRLREFSDLQQGKKYNFKGIVMFMPFMVSRRVCELPLVNEQVRSNCLTILANVQLADEENPESDRFFCSEFVLAGYRYAGIELLAGQANWVSPADLLHLREGDVSAWHAQQPIEYIGHLKRWNLKEILSLRSPDRQAQ